MAEGELLAMLRQAEERLRQLEYRITLLETRQGQAEQALGGLRSMSAS